ncbi:MAG: protein-disulfide reductase DsbD family protein [Candidatus Eiseniibacteriota bacterium]
MITRMLTRTFVLLAVLIAATVLPCGSSLAQEAGGAGAQNAPPPATDKLVRVKVPSDLKASQGETIKVELEFEVLETWHVNAHRPNEDFLVPTVFSVRSADGVSAGEVRYPDAKQVTLSFSETPLAVYEGDFEIVVPLRVAPDAAPGPRTVNATLRFQSCNDQVCLPPASIPVKIALMVEGEPVSAPAAGAAGTGGATGTSGATGTAADTSAGGTTSGGTSAPPVGAFETAPPPGAQTGASGAASVAGGNLVGRWFTERGSFLAFVLIFLMGLALNLTPCVYPMMGVTVSLFGAQAAGPGVRPGAGGGAGGSSALAALPKAIVYVLGIALMYSTLGVVAAMTGGFFGGWLANPWVLGGIGALLLAMALSMFGLYELQAPSALLSKLGGAAGAGYLGTFLAGLLVGVFAAPCIGPPIIALLAHVGSRADPVFGFWVFFVLSLGLGLPYLVLGVSSGLLAKLPRSGSWMDWVKHLFGVILLAVAAFYLCLAIAPSKIGWVVPLALLLGGIYLGFLEPTGRERPAFRRFKWALGTFAIVAAALIAFRPQPATARWDAFSETALAEARSSGRPIILDFSADWCVPCHELDQVTFSDPRVIREIEPFVRMKVDLTRFDSEQSIELRQRFAIPGVPTIVFLGPDGREVADARIVGFIKPDPFLERVRLARTTVRPAGS